MKTALSQEAHPYFKVHNFLVQFQVHKLNEQIDCSHFSRIAHRQMAIQLCLNSQAF